VRITLPGGGELHVSGGGSVPEAPPKKSKPLRADLAEGGSNKMHGHGDRAKTAPEDSAGKQAPGHSGHSTSSRGSVLAEGGDTKMFKRQGADPAQSGRTGKGRSAATSASIGGIARPARPGSCGT
jgi:hypothetical protein